RVPIIANLEELDADALTSILTEPKNALVKQYRRMLELDDVELEFDEEALVAVAELAIERKTGARGLRSIIEERMVDICLMYLQMIILVKYVLLKIQLSMRQIL